MKEYSDLNKAQLQRMLKAAEELAARQLDKIRKLERKADSIARKLAKCEESQEQETRKQDNDTILVDKSPEHTTNFNQPG